MYPVALILAPTRELASQIYEEGRKVSVKSVNLVVLFGAKSNVCYKSIKLDLFYCRPTGGSAVHNDLHTRTGVPV